MDVENVHGTEDYVLSRSPASPFLLWSSEIYSSALLKINMYADSNLPGNKFNNVMLCEKILKLYMPTLPLWSSILICKQLSFDDSRCQHTHPVAVCKQVLCTTGRHEQQFTILKTLMLGSRTNLRMDEFSQILHDLFLATEKDFVVMYLRQHHKRMSKCNTAPMQEIWAKKNKQKPSLAHPKLGKYQQSCLTGIKDHNLPPKHTASHSKTGEVTEIHKASLHGRICRNVSSQQRAHVAMSQDPHAVQIKDFCPMPNLGHTCWFNAAMQALHKSYAICSLINSRQCTVDLNSDEVSVSILHSRLLEVWEFMSTTPWSTVPHSLLRCCLSGYSTLFPAKK